MNYTLYEYNGKTYMLETNEKAELMALHVQVITKKQRSYLRRLWFASGNAPNPFAWKVWQAYRSL